MYYDTNEATMTNECTSSAGRFDGHGGAPEQYRWHCPMRHVQGYSGSHWMPPSGNYSLLIAPAAARATANETMTKKSTKKNCHFDGRGSVLVQYRMHRPIEGVQDYDRSHWLTQPGKYCGQ
jgi:hypothetical protein